MNRTKKIINKLILLVLMCICTMSCYSQAKDTQQTKSSVFIYVDNFPAFKEGGDGIHSFLKKHLRWPKTELDVQGTVLTSFIVLENGSIRDIKIERSLAKEFDDEAIRAIRAMPRWRPGTLNGNAVKVKVYFPINFFLK